MIRRQSQRERLLDEYDPVLGNLERTTADHTDLVRLERVGNRRGRPLLKVDPDIRIPGPEPPQDAREGRDECGGRESDPEAPRSALHQGLDIPDAVLESREGLAHSRQEQTPGFRRPDVWPTDEELGPE